MEDSEDNPFVRPTFKWSKYWRILFFVLGVVVFLGLFYFFFLTAPGDFKPNTVVSVEEGATLRSVSLKLKNARVITSRGVFEAFVILYGSEKKILRADYLFENKLPVWQVARRIARGEHHMTAITITIPEGLDTKAAAQIFVAKLPAFDTANFLNLAKGKEGSLFPDTYFFFSVDDELDVLALMNQNFEKKMKELRPGIALSGRTEKQIIIMASVLEREAKGDSDREIVSGILWKRLDIGMPLQVDAVPETYKTKGLPKAPLGNPGILAIRATLYPKSSPYFYYLHDKAGVTHYARNFAEHRANILRYLK